MGNEETIERMKFKHHFYTIEYANNYETDELAMTLTDNESGKVFSGDEQLWAARDFWDALERIEKCKIDLVRQWCEYQKKKGNDRTIWLHKFLNS